MTVAQRHLAPMWPWAWFASTQVKVRAACGRPVKQRTLVTRYDDLDCQRCWKLVAQISERSHD